MLNDNLQCFMPKEAFSIQKCRKEMVTMNSIFC